MDLAEKCSYPGRTIHIGHNHNLRPWQARNVFPPFNVLVIEKVGDRRSRSTDASGDCIPGDRRHAGEQALHTTLNEPLIAHPDIKSFNCVRNRTCVGSAKEVENYGCDLFDGFHKYVLKD